LLRKQGSMCAPLILWFQGGGLAAGAVEDEIRYLDDSGGQGLERASGNVRREGVTGSDPPLSRATRAMDWPKATAEAEGLARHPISTARRSLRERLDFWSEVPRRVSRRAS
jgi:hypothetical protein